MKKVFVRFMIPILAVIALVGLDQWSKYLTIKYIPLNTSVVLLDNIFELHYLRNEGMAWGMLQNKQMLFIIFTPIILIVLGYLFVKTPHEKKFYQIRMAEVLLASGAIGNMIDRIFRGELFHGYVVDMFYVKAINFPVFNVADSYVSISFVWMVILVLFVYKDEDFSKILNFGFKRTKTETVETVQEELEEDESH